jgi:hypothetical protein
MPFKPRSPSDSSPVIIGGAAIDGSTSIFINGQWLTVRALGELFTSANNFAPLFTSASHTSRGRPRAAADDLAKTASAHCVTTAAAAVFAVFASFPTAQQLSQLSSRLLHFRSLAGLPCDAVSHRKLTPVQFLFAVIELEIPERLWGMVVKLLDVQLDGSLRSVKQLRRHMHSLLPVLPLAHGAFTHTTWLLGLWSEMLKPQLDLCHVVAQDAPASRFLVLKLGGDGTSGYRSHGASTNVECVNAHPLSLLGRYVRCNGAAMLAGVALAPEERTALNELWQPLCEPLARLPRWKWAGAEWRVLPLHDGTSLLVCIHVAADGACIAKLSGLSSSVFDRDDDNPAACLLCDATRADCVALRTSAPRTTSGQCARGLNAQQELIRISSLPQHKQGAERKQLMAQEKNTTVSVYVVLG